MKKIKESFVGKDLAFVYLCSGSTQKNWEFAISKHDVKGQHYLLSNKQFYDLQEKFQINAYPTYLLIDKNGNIIRDIPRASDPGGLKNFLNKYSRDWTLPEPMKSISLDSNIFVFKFFYSTSLNFSCFRHSSLS